MALIRSKLIEIVKKLYVTSIATAHGELGIVVAEAVMEHLQKIYSYVEPELIEGSLVVFKTLLPTATPSLPATSVSLISAEYLTQVYDKPTRLSSTVIRIHDNGELSFWRNTNIDTSTLSSEAIVYVYENKQEFFIVSGEKKDIINPDTTYCSVFSIPTFKHLIEALEDYRQKKVRFSSCPILKTAWNGNHDSRLFFKSKPEHIMRDSLIEHLKTVLRDAEVRPEQIVDASHPVDIKITWMFTNRLALIEIKWLGKSITENGGFVEYSESRARSGADQLANYLDANQEQAPTHQTMGYLIIFDARRRGLNDINMTSISYENGMWYKTNEIEYNPQYHLIRHDFYQPIRMFVEPRCNAD